MERQDPRIRPQCLRVFSKLVRSDRVLRVRLCHHRYIIRFRHAPPLRGLTVPKRRIPVVEDLPDTVFLDVFILVEAAFPPLDQASWVGLCNALVRASGHDCAHPAPCPRASVVNVNDVLQHSVVEEEAVDGPIASRNEGVSETSDIEATGSFFSFVAAAEEFNVCIGVICK